MIESGEYPYLQESGQRKYGGPPPNWVGPPPPKGTEVFVSKLPRDATLSEICPVFAMVGEIYAARLMMDFSGSNRGYCFIQYRRKSEAKLAIEQLDNYKIRPGFRISVTKSLDNCRLFIGQVPKDLNKEDIKQILNSLTTGVKEVILYLSPTDKTLNRGFCFVEYTDHRSAAMARRTLIAGGIPGWGRDIRIDWAIPEEDIDEEVMSQVTVIYIRNLMLLTSEATLREIICKGVAASDVTRVRKVKDFAFVHFRTREAAEKAMTFLDGFILDGAKIMATWAKPTPPDEMSNVLTQHIKKERKKIEGKKKTEMNNKANSPNGLLNNNYEKSIMSYQQNPQLYISTTLPQGMQPIRPCSSDNINLAYTYPFHPVPTPVNTLPVVPFVCPPISPLKEEVVKTIVDTYLTSYIPAVALRYIFHRLGWGEVYFDVNFEVDWHGCALFKAHLIIVKADRTVQYPPVKHPPAFSPYDAKNFAAIMFIKYYILSKQNISS